eukprot:2428047-Amphidinium_carterae.1
MPKKLWEELLSDSEEIPSCAIPSRASEGESRVSSEGRAKQRRLEPSQETPSDSRLGCRELSHA